jgi:ubiquinone/menaquinone biosynthesis C-methylase UbiE
MVFEVKEMAYPQWFDEIVRCPETGSKLSSIQEGYIRPDGVKYLLQNDILSLVYPPSLIGQDAKFNKLYNVIAPFYDLSERILGRLITGMDIIEGRKEIISRLHIPARARLLEVSPGPGVFQKSIREYLTSRGEFVSLDLSLQMLRQCQRRNSALDIKLVHGNGQYLPFADNSFDVLFHFGGVNLFNDPEKAIQEFVRVVKRNGIVGWGDEGFSRNYTSKIRKKILSKMNPGFMKPMPAIPDTLFDVQLHEVFGGLGYFLTSRKK